MECVNTKCIKCGNEDAITFLVELVPCTDCGNTTTINYNKCEECGIIWKSVGDVVLSVLELEDVLFPEGIPGDFLSDLLNLENIPVVEHVTEDATMESQIHRCIRCYSAAFESKENFYKCSNDECGFEWEIIKCG